MAPHSLSPRHLPTRSLQIDYTQKDVAKRERGRYTAAARRVTHQQSKRRKVKLNTVYGSPGIVQQRGPVPD